MAAHSPPIRGKKMAPPGAWDTQVWGWIPTTAKKANEASGQGWQFKMNPHLGSTCSTALSAQDYHAFGAQLLANQLPLMSCTMSSLLWSIDLMCIFSCHFSRLELIISVELFSKFVMGSCKSLLLCSWAAVFSGWGTVLVMLVCLLICISNMFQYLCLLPDQFPLCSK